MSVSTVPKLASAWDSGASATPIVTTTAAVAEGAVRGATTTSPSLPVLLPEAPTESAAASDVLLLVSTPVPRCRCCGSGWHRLSIWLFRLSICIIVVQALLHVLELILVLTLTSRAEVVAEVLSLLLVNFGELVVSLGTSVSMRKELFPCCACCCDCCFTQRPSAPIDVITTGPTDTSPSPQLGSDNPAATPVHSSTSSNSIQAMEYMREKRDGCLYQGVCCFIVHVILLGIVVAVLMAISWLYYVAIRSMPDQSIDGLWMILVVPMLKTIGWFLFFIALVVHFSSSS